MHQGKFVTTLLQKMNIFALRIAPFDPNGSLYFEALRIFPPSGRQAPRKVIAPLMG